MRFSFVIPMGVLVTCPFLIAQGIVPAVAKDLSFASAITIPSPVLYPQSIAAADVNHDGIADLAVVGEENPGVCTTTDWKSGAWDCSGIAGDAPEQIIFADINMDGNPDVVGTDADLPIVTVGYGNGRGQFHNGSGLRTHSGYATQQAAVADLNGDGIPDVVCAALGTGDDPGSIAIFLGQGQGHFAPAKNTSSGGNVPFSVAVGDLNRDGIPDLVIANFGTERNGDYGSIAIRLGKPNGTFAAPVIYTGLHDPLQVVLADFNLDGNLDIAVVSLGRDQVLILLGKGDGTFSSPVKQVVLGGVGRIEVADLNGDGIPDLLATIGTEQEGGVAISLGNGDGTFQAPLNFMVGLNPQEIVIGDLNGDGKPDIATINGGDSTVSILLNTTRWSEREAGKRP